MEAKDLKAAMEEAEDKFSVLEDPEVFKKYQLTIAEFIGIVKDFLSDAEKQRLFELNHISIQSTNIKSKILEAINDDTIRMQVMETVDIGLEKFGAVQIIKKFGDTAKLQVIHNAGFRSRFGLESFEIVNIAKGLNEAERIGLLSEIDFIFEELELMPHQVGELISSIGSEDKRLELMDMHIKSEKSKINTYYAREIVSSFSNERKVSIVLDNEYCFDRNEIECILATLDIPELIAFFNEHKEFLEENEISPHAAFALVKEENQPEIAKRIDDLDFDTKERKLVLVSLKNRVKAKIDASSMSEDYRTALSMQRGESFIETGTFGRIIVDLNRNLEDYRDFDEYIVINPKEITEEERVRQFKLCEICPKIQITDDLGLNPSTAEEYIRAEEWITQVLEGIDANWSNIQKVAYVDNQIGRRISYTPDFGTEVCDLESARALWRIIDSGYGVCNGIAQVEQYILGRLRN